MGLRLELQALFEELLGSRNVYFQPPETIKLNYPCIIYERSSNKAIHANNNPFVLFHKYTVTLIDKNPDTVLPDKLHSLPKTNFDRSFVNDNLYHYVFTIYF